MTQLRLFGLLILLICAAGNAHGQSKKQKQLEAQRQAILAEIKQINTLLFRTQGEKKSVLTEVEDLNQRIAAQENLIRVTNQQANLLTREINDNLKKMDQLRTELTLLKEDYSGMIQKSYKSKSQQNRVMFLLSSDNFLQAYKRLQYMKQYAKHRKEQGNQIQLKTEQLQVLNTSLLAQKNDKQLLIEENKIAKTRLSKEKQQQEALIASLRQEEGKFASQIRSKQREANRIDKQIDDIIRAEIAAANKKAGKKPVGKAEVFVLNAEAKALAADFTSNKGKLPWPITKGGVVTARYGTHPHPQFPNIKEHNSGVKIATEKNSKARAVFAGTVFKIQQIKGSNLAVYIRHGNYITVYHNITNVLVKKGDQVGTKQEIGTVFTNPVTGKTVLKFLVYRNDKRMNPADWIYRM